MHLIVYILFKLFEDDIEEQLHEGILRLKQQAVDAGQVLKNNFQ